MPAIVAPVIIDDRSLDYRRNSVCILVARVSRQHSSYWRQEHCWPTMKRLANAQLFYLTYHYFKSTNIIDRAYGG